MGLSLNLYLSIKSVFNRIPKQAMIFLVRACFLYIVWVCVYHFYLGPQQILDPPLTRSVAFISCKILQLMFPGELIVVAQQGAYIALVMGDKAELSIMDGCNALELYVFYIGFIICYSGPFKLSLKFILWGVLGIFLLNIARCVALFCLDYNHFPYIDGVHHYVFTIAVYFFIFMLWLNFFKISLKSTN